MEISTTAVVFNDYFVSIFTKQLHRCDLYYKDSELNKISNSTCRVFAAFLTASLGAGHDSESENLLSQSAEKTTPHVKQPFRNSLETKLPPALWKLPFNINVYKNENRLRISSYRTVCIGNANQNNLPLKIMEVLSDRSSVAPLFGARIRRQGAEYQNTQ